MIKAAPLISIPLCTFNGARYLRAQLDSLLAQTYRPIEIVAVDDGSIDDTVAILREYADRHAALRVEINAANLGFKRNFERALLLCNGDFIAPCDQDDAWLPGKLVTLHGIIADKCLAYCDSEFIDADGRALGRKLSNKWRMGDIDDPAAFVLENNISGHAMLFKRVLLNRALPIPEGLFHDWWLAAVAASAGGIVYCPQVLVRYRQHATNVTRRVDNAAQVAGFGTCKVREAGLRIARLAALPGPSQLRLRHLARVWERRERQWVSFALAWWMARHGDRVLSLKRRSPMKRFGVSLEYLPGLRLKRLFNPHKYAI